MEKSLFCCVFIFSIFYFHKSFNSIKKLTKSTIKKYCELRSITIHNMSLPLFIMALFAKSQPLTLAVFTYKDRIEGQQGCI